MDTTPFLIVDFRLVWRGEIVYFIVYQSLSSIFESKELCI
jgi:hypothetical protein